MIIIRTLPETGKTLSSLKMQEKSIGLVPTMGALHMGHVSLLEHCRRENDISIVSIFVNPTQFNDPKDLKRYPRNEEKDLEVLKKANCDIVFIPGLKTVYPEPDKRFFEFGNLDKVMEGRFRPGHFNGVAQVVSRLFQIIEPDKAYFGEKDLQQLAIIKEMTRMLGLPVKIRACPTLREDDGLAMSSRNVFLNSEQRKNAALIRKTLNEAIEKTDMEVEELKKWVTVTINSTYGLEVEYFEVVAVNDLQPLRQLYPGQQAAGCIAVRIGEIRLIDNIFFPNFVPS
jgi:pantoate--beta-alanine ligase